ncbi:sugar-binding protein [Neobacillus sedimentimangrovi]|jgi:ribose transport system substrate-binding protein|uniref:Sugar-binding protein n=1 Tax=Neobacillus sedimentimangrovi TaxID=2699460 RepID=A0ABS8QDX7_9BACI|nr:sugar-binding protein [Neobacillus sedimentimangrovi]AIM16884.1 LacI family transcriptional regulator [Bacillus sp. X1(2014)]MCD4837469.1 sugar-binding protein [Neobacillus sedimentimangrovi]
MSRLSITAYVVGIVCFIVSCSFAVFYGYKVVTHQLPTEEKELNNDRYHFVLIPEELDNDYWRLVEEGARAAAKKYDVLLEYTGPRQANFDDHLKTIEMSAAAKVDGIMTQGLSDEQFSPLINRIVEKGIPVITVDTDAANSKRLAYIGTDNYYSGFLAGKALIADTNGQANVAIITGSFNKNHQRQRVQGFKDAIQSEKGIRIVAIEESQISRVRAFEKAYQILQEHPEVTAFFGTSALDGIGVAEVVEKFNKQKRIYIIGFDLLKETQKYIRKGTIQATVVQEPFEMGYRAVKMMIELREGKKVPSIIHTATRILRKNDLPPYMNNIKGVR